MIESQWTSSFNLHVSRIFSRFASTFCVLRSENLCPETVLKRWWRTPEGFKTSAGHPKNITSRKAQLWDCVDFPQLDENVLQDLFCNLQISELVMQEAENLLLVKIEGFFEGILVRAFDSWWERIFFHGNGEKRTKHQSWLTWIIQQLFNAKSLKTPRIKIDSCTATALRQMSYIYYLKF